MEFLCFSPPLSLSIANSHFLSLLLCIDQLRHEFTLSRVYVVSGSFRAFDRRPLGTVVREETSQQVQQHAAAAAVSSDDHDHDQDTQIMEKTSSSPESSCSGGDHLHLQASPAPIDDFPWDWDPLDGL